MDDPLVGITIWQSAQLSKKIRARQDLLKEVLGGEGGSLANGWAAGSGGRETEATSGVSGRRNERARGGGADRETGGESACSSPRTLGGAGGRETRENGEVGEPGEEEEELTERTLLSREGGQSSKGHAQTSHGLQETQPQNFWLMRLFESKLFDMSIAIGYFLSSKEADVQAYLGNKLFVSAHLTICVLCCVVLGMVGIQEASIHCITCVFSSSFVWPAIKM